MYLQVYLFNCDLLVGTQTRLFEKVGFVAVMVESFLLIKSHRAQGFIFYDFFLQFL
jgi:hypothetical protein